MPDNWDDSGDDDDWEANDLTLPGANDKKDEDAWSDEEGHDAHKAEAEAEKAAAAVPAAPKAPKPKTGLELKIEQREQREKEEAERKAALKKKMQAESGAVDVADMDEETARRRRAEEDAAMEGAIDAFGLDDSSAASSKAAASSSSSEKPADTAAAEARSREPVAQAGDFENLAPKGEADFEKLATMMNKKLTPFEGTKGHLTCLKALIRFSTENMSVDDVKDLAATLSVVQNAKLAAERDKDKTKKNVKKAKGKFNAAAMNARSNLDGDDITDFM